MYEVNHVTGVVYVGKKLTEEENLAIASFRHNGYTIKPKRNSATKNKAYYESKLQGEQLKKFEELCKVNFMKAASYARKECGIK